MTIARWPVFALFIAVLAIGAPAFAGDDHAPGAPVILDESKAAPGEKELLGRLVAPCCWNQTLDVHGGAAPDQLRAEIRKRLLSGESAASIEADFVARYGDRVRASSDSSSLGSAGFVVGGFALMAGVALIYAVRRWLRTARAAKANAAPAVPEERDALDAQLDDELRAMD
ncbi:MAG: cytochrome c-type biogenesis protein CcmH [Myxococcales bacterium]|nr:cytochrome c-type biogenesis protein CcmH [Myxococcales bacterium]